MRREIGKFSLFLLFAIVLIGTACGRKFIDRAVVTSETEHYVFPDDWLGYWEGELNIYNASGLVQKIPMALDHAKTEVDSVWTWAIIYGEDKVKGRRDYQLKAIDREKGRYVTDEKNGILLDAQLFNNELISVFEVMGNRLISKYKREGNELFFEILMYDNDVSKTSGNTVMGSDTIPEVQSFLPRVVQKGVLRRR